MKARVQYNDFKGTAAADISDNQSLKDFLQSKGVDTARFDPIGAKFYYGYSSFFSYDIICKDTASAEQKAVKITFESKDSPEEFFDLFKRFNVIITWNKGGGDYSNWDLEENPIVIDDRE